MKKYLKNVYDAGTIAFHYTILYSTVGSAVESSPKRKVLAGTSLADF